MNYRGHAASYAVMIPIEVLLVAIPAVRGRFLAAHPITVADQAR
ncbi:MAG: hypothetical protein Q4P32_12925 [Micrococcales bacterium]|nr:hypothetical protein [Micrococcales bacterium]